ncbi:Centrin-2 Caltractin isoform 1 [Collichthys lucidus]|uniref:Centrin-2 Caltractin isoform 1 n=1 Tax=Collichthys lucidus TaxID=240159 RepID=A0A4V6AP60_COLLU|nr:Centrin-2 Caltractin isoform 1 [Collichthys lucidus]
MASGSTPASSESQRKNAVPQIKLTEEQRQQLMEAFNVFDKEAAGKIDVWAIKVVIQALGYEPSKEEIKRILATVDKDDTGRIDFEGFVTIMAFKMAEPDSDEEITKSFRLFEDSRTGVIEFDDLKRAAEELGENLTDEEIKEMIHGADPNKLGAVTKRQYLLMMKNGDV